MINRTYSPYDIFITQKRLVHWNFWVSLLLTFSLYFSMFVGLFLDHVEHVDCSVEPQGCVLYTLCCRLLRPLVPHPHSCFRGPTSITRMSPQFLKAAIMQSHDCAQYLKICTNLGLLNTNQEKLAKMLNIYHNLTMLYSFTCLYDSFMNVTAQNFNQFVYLSSHLSCLETIKTGYLPIISLEP